MMSPASSARLRIISKSRYVLFMLAHSRQEINRKYCFGVVLACGKLESIYQLQNATTACKYSNNHDENNQNLLRAIELKFRADAP